MVQGSFKSTFDISNSEGTGKNDGDRQSSRYQEMGLKQIFLISAEF